MLTCLCTQLEVIEGQLWANVWQSECIARIDLNTGAVVEWVLLHGLRAALLKRNPQQTDMDVLNGVCVCGTVL